MNLDSPKNYQSADPQDVGYGIEHLPEQGKTAWLETRDLVVPTGYGRVRNVVIAGMGGSALGAHILTSVFANDLAVPVEIWCGYGLPGYVDKASLVILSSFSGGTEETLSSAEEARRCGAKVMVIGTGGELKKLAKKHGWPGYFFDPGDLAKQPRLGVGFSLVGLIGLLERLRILKVREREIELALKAMGEVIDSCAVDVDTRDNCAKQVAKELVGRQVLVVGAEHLFGNAHVLANQINETSKQFAVPFALSELNHHLLEGFSYPKSFSEKTTVLLLESKLYGDRLRKRFPLTADIFESVGCEIVEYATQGSTRFEEAAEVLQFGSYVSYYLGLLNSVDPSTNPFVDEFKKRLM